MVVRISNRIFANLAVIRVMITAMIGITKSDLILAIEKDAKTLEERLDDIFRVNQLESSPTQVYRGMYKSEVLEFKEILEIIDKLPTNEHGEIWMTKKALHDEVSAEM